MPTKRQMESVTAAIKKLQAARYGFPDKDGDIPTDMGNLCVPGNKGVSWGWLNKHAQGETMYYLVWWEGFSEKEKEAVIERVTNGYDAKAWMAGIKLEPIKAAPDMDMER